MTSPYPSQAPYKQLRRPTTDRMVAGVASGLGRYFAVDPTLVRVVFAVATILTGGLAALAYPVLWFLMPEEPAGAPAWPHPPQPGQYPSGYPPASPHPAWPTNLSTGPTPPAGPTTPSQPGGPVPQAEPTAPAGQAGAAGPGPQAEPTAPVPQVGPTAPAAQDGPDSAGPGAPGGERGAAGPVAG
ncbi:PspC domain-containing protein [Micromonospora fluostatini]|uniref:PspC domain-containing protein n=1 Tax=Micromonospora sp. JCM 30529 TaxID=3421643 RepID=UPI003D17CCA2